MRYLGGKYRLAKWIVGHLHRLDVGRGFLDLFTGSGAIVANLRPDRVRVACDANRAMITTLQHVQAGWLPGPIDATEYARLRVVNDPKDPLTAVAGFGCSFGGDWFSGYVRDAGPRWFQPDKRNGGNVLQSMLVTPCDQQARASLAKMAPKLRGVHFHACDFRELQTPPPGVVVDEVGGEHVRPGHVAEEFGLRGEFLGIVRCRCRRA